MFVEEVLRLSKAISLEFTPLLRSITAKSEPTTNSHLAVEVLVNEIISTA